jgi:hypothetical protein
MSTPQVVRILVEAYQNSQYAMEARQRIQEILQIVRTSCMATVQKWIHLCKVYVFQWWLENPVRRSCLQSSSSSSHVFWGVALDLRWMQQGTVLESGGSQAGFFRQSFTLTRRSFVNMSRDIGYYWLRLVIYIVLSVCLGTIYWKVGLEFSSILVWHFLSLTLNKHF